MTNVVITAPLHEETRGKLWVAKVDAWGADDHWIAWRAGFEGRNGWGATEQAAIADLLEKERTCPTS